MQRVGEFEKVSFEQFSRAVKDEFGLVAPKAQYDNIQLPSRATAGSAGYDFRSPFEFTVAPGNSIKIPTGIRAKIDEGWWLGCLPRSSHGFKCRMQLANTIGVIDSDYYNTDNEGHIFVKITNDSGGGKAIHIKTGDKFIQAIFIPYGVTYSDDVGEVRTGGIGSTGV